MADIKYTDLSGLDYFSDKIKSILDDKANTSSLGSYAYKSGSNASGTWPISITGNASSATLLKPNSGITTDVAAWDPLSSYTKCWGQKFINSLLSSDTGDILYYLRRGDSGYGTSATTELCICIDGDYYGKGGGGTPKKVSYEGHNHTKSQITDFPTSLPASDVYAWAKAANKPTYTASEVGAAESGHNHDSIYCKYSHNYSVSAGDGNNHYYKILTLTVTANAAWHDMFYEVKVSGRGTYYGNIRIFAATHAVDKYIGQIEITCDGSVKDLLYAYQIRNTTTKTDTIELWMNVVGWGTFYFYEREYKNSGGISITVNKTDGGALPTSYHDKINISGQVTNGNSVLGHIHTKSEVGLGNVDNTADANKSVNHANTAGSATNAHNIISSNGTNLLKSNSSGEITITSPTDLLTINSTGKQTYSLLYFSKNGTRKACTGYYEGMAFISNETSPYPRIGVKDDGTPQYWSSNNSSTAQTILHTGNYTTWCATSGHDHNNVYAAISHGIHWNNFSNRALNSATWGTLTSANGYTPIFWMDSVNGGGVAFSDYDGQTFMQIDGDYYANEGKSKVWHAGNLTKVSQLTNDSGYLTSLPSHSHDYLPLTGGTLTGTSGLTLQNSKLWVQGGSDAGSNSNRMTLDYGAPADMKYQSGKRGLMLYSNAIAICDPYNGNSNNDSAWIRHIEETPNTSVLEIALGDDSDTSEELRFRKYNTSNQIVYDILVPRKSGTVALTSDIPTNNNQLTNGAGYITVSGSITGNAATATLATSAKRCSTKQSSVGNSSVNYYKVTGLIEHTSNRQATYIITTRLNENYYISVGTCDGDNTKLPHITRIHNSYSKITGFTYKSGVLYIKTVAYNNTVGVANITNLSDTTVAIVNSSESEYNTGTIVPIWDNLNSGNSSVSKSGETLTVKINGTEYSLTNTNTWPTNLNQLTNGPGYITGITKTMVTNALGYTPPTSDTNTWLGDGAWAPGTNVKLNATANDQEWSFDIERNDKTGCHWHVWDSSLKSLLIVYPDNGIVEAPYGFKGSLTGNASSATLLKPNSGITTDVAAWNPLSSYTKCWGQKFISSSLSSDTGDILYYLRRGDSGYGSSGTTELCICIDGDYYGKGGGGTPKKVSYEDHTHTSFASSITVTGKVSASQGFFQTSDERLKDFQNDIQVDLDKIKALPKKYFTWKSDESKERQIGTSAQAIKDIYPELVSTGDNGKLSVAYDKLSIIALKAVDELHDENQKLKDEVNQLRSDIDKIKQMLGI